MLAERRRNTILSILDQKGSVTVQELADILRTSESTIRRDLTDLDQKGALTKVFGGAVRPETKGSVQEEQVSTRKEIHAEEKKIIGRYAAGLIEPEDFVYIDAGTTTAAIIPFIEEKSATYVTNAVSHALELVHRGFHVILIGGELKEATEALVGGKAYESLSQYHFTKSFMGTNGIDIETGCTTPDLNESIVKNCAVTHSKECYIVCTIDKFRKVYPVRFAEYEGVRIITDEMPEGNYDLFGNIEIAK